MQPTIADLILQLSTEKEELGLTLIEQGAELTLPASLKDYTTAVRNMKSKVDLEELKTIFVPRNLSEMSILNDSDRSKTFLYIDGNKKVSISQLNSYTIRTVDSIPNDFQPGEYIFLRIGGNNGNL